MRLRRLATPLMAVAAAWVSSGCGTLPALPVGAAAVAPTPAEVIERSRMAAPAPGGVMALAAGTDPAATAVEDARTAPRLALTVADGPPTPLPPAAREPGTPSGAAPQGGGAAPTVVAQTDAQAADSAPTPDPADDGLPPPVNEAEAALDEGVLRDWSDAAVDDPGSRTDLWERVRRGFAMPDLDTALVRRWERWYAGKPEYMQRMADRASLYLFHIVEEVERRGLPMELALLPFVESAFNPHAVSSASAMGMWQFMPATGRKFDLKQNLFLDDRRAVQASTRAALEYLQTLHGMFGDWHLALAGYNWGEGNVQRAIARNRQARRPSGYLALRMPRETRDYVPKLQAIANIVRDPARFGLELPPLQNHPFFLSVAIDRDIDVALILELADLEPPEFRALNPQLNKPVVLAAATPEILLPYDNARRFVRERDAHDGPLASWTAWVAPRTLHPAEAARLNGMGEDTLREVNRIPAQMMIRQGSTLLVTRKPSMEADVTEKVADNAAIRLAPAASAGAGTRYVRVGRKPTTLASMARIVGVAVADLASWNGLSVDAMLKPRQRLKVLTPSPAARPAAVKSPPARESAPTVRKTPASRSKR